MSRARTTVYYDGGCPTCLKGVRHYQRLDWAGRLRWVDLMREPGALAERGIAFARAMEHMHVVDRDGTLRVGMHGFTALWTELPGYRHLATVLSVTGLVEPLDRFYRHLTRGRFARRCASGACPPLPESLVRCQAGELAPELGAPRIRAMFERIATRYDLMNDLMSFGIHRAWKRRLVWALDARPGETIVDLAGGTGDVARRLVSTGARVVVCDPSLGMMRVGRARHIRTTGWLAGVGERLPFDDRSLDALVVAFGVRNMASMSDAFSEALRVLRPGGRFACLEFSRPHPMVRPLYRLFSRTVIPMLGAAVARDPDAYRYLVDSIERFPAQETLAELLRASGFAAVRYRNVSFGIGCIHLAEARHGTARRAGSNAHAGSGGPTRRQEPAASAASSAPG